MATLTHPTRRHRLGSTFWISVVVSALFVAWAALSTQTLSKATGAALDWVTGNLGWMYLATTLGLLVLLVFLACSRYGRIRLGADTDRPEFSTRAWLSMILAAVMGIGLVSYSVAEPISHFSAPPHGLAEPGTPEAAVRALQYSYFDWGLHAWAVFAVFGLAIGYSTHRKGRPGLVSAMFYPLLGERVNGPLGKAIDVLAIFATLFGTTTSLGLGALQIDNGMNSLFGTPSGTLMQVGIVALITLVFTASAVTGVHKGIRFLSEGSMGLAIALFVFMLVVGPAVFVANLFLQSVGTYASDFFRMSLQGTAFGGLAWMQWWTYFMMAWWIAWGAFVGVFLAKISKGRTIREFIAGVLIVPSVVFFGWFATFGGTAINLDMFHGGTIAQATSQNINSAFFATLDAFPLSGVTSVVAILLVVMFFVSGADANTYVLSMMSTGGDLNPGRPVLVVWGVLTGATAIALLMAGGLTALQQTVIVTSAPFVVIIIGLAVAFCRELRHDPVAQTGHPAAAEVVSQRPVVGAGLDRDGQPATSQAAASGHRVGVGADMH
jgi:glycine betaine transporter